MGAERELFIDIDRQPERERPRPSGVPAARPGSADPLWPALDAGGAGQPSPDLGATPPGMAPVDGAPPRSAGPASNLGILPTMPLSADLVESLAVLAPRASVTRPLSLAEALAAMQAPPPPRAPSAAPPPAPPVESEPAPEPPVEGPSAADHSFPLSERPAAPPESAPAPPEPPGLPETSAGWSGSDVLYRIRAADEEMRALPELVHPPAARDDGYLTRTYDLTRPAAAELYERAVVPLWSAPFGLMLLSAFQAQPRQPGWQVVDVGCGTGYPTLDLARLLGPDGDVAGIDVWGAGIEHARARARALGLDNLAFLVADVADCDLPDGSFDVATCNLSLPSFAHPEAALRGIARLLRSNGTLILTTNLRGTMPEFFGTYRAVLNDLGLLDLSWDVERLVYLQPTLERVEALLDMTGFAVERMLNDHFVLEFPDGSTFLRSPMIALSFLQSWRSVISDLALRRVVFNEIERRLNAHAAAWGRLDLMVPMLCVTARRCPQK